jgi:hypothetical protein
VLRVGDVSPLKVEVRDSPVRAQGMSAVLDYAYVNAQEHDSAEPRGYDYSASHRGAYSSTAQPTLAYPSSNQKYSLTQSYPTLRLIDSAISLSSCGSAATALQKSPKTKYAKAANTKHAHNADPMAKKHQKKCREMDLILNWGTRRTRFPPWSRRVRNRPSSLIACRRHTTIQIRHRSPTQIQPHTQTLIQYLTPTRIIRHTYTPIQTRALVQIRKHLLIQFPRGNRAMLRVTAAAWSCSTAHLHAS